ncbi:MAG: RNA repair domain-containing protein [Methanoregula sp.]
MLTSHRILQQYWHDGRYDIRHIRVWYIDRGAPDDRSMAQGHDISLEPYYMIIRTSEGEKSIPYHRILLIMYNGDVVFENQKIEGLAGRIAAETSFESHPGA